MNKCINCSERKLTCHDTCEDYRKFKKEREIANQRYKSFMDGLGWDGNLRFQMKRG